MPWKFCAKSKGKIYINIIKTSELGQHKYLFWNLLLKNHCLSWPYLIEFYTEIHFVYKKQTCHIYYIQTTIFFIHFTVFSENRQKQGKTLPLFSMRWVTLVFLFLWTRKHQLHVILLSLTHFRRLQVKNTGKILTSAS